MTRGNLRRQRSELSSASSENSSPAAKRPNEEMAVEQWNKTHDDMWKMLLDIKSDLSKILTENLALCKDVEELKAAVHFNDSNMSALKTAVDQIAASVKKYEEDLAQHKSAISKLDKSFRDLEVNQDSLEQYTRKYNVEIHGFPEQQDANLKDIISSIAGKLNVNIRSQDIDIVHRLYRKPPTVKPIIVRFSSYTKKQEARFKLREVDLSSLFPGEASHTLYINENLTSRRKELLAKTLSLKKDKSYHRVWTKDGKKFLRLSEGTKAIKIYEEADLDKFK